MILPLDDQYTPFPPELISKSHYGVIQSFRSYFSSQGYHEHTPVDINSRLDPSVYFIGSTISVLKPYLFAASIPEPGLFLVQRCVRTQNSKLLLTDSEMPKWASYFQSIGTLSPITKLKQVCMDVWNFLHISLGIPKHDIMIRASSRDQDLLEFWTEMNDGPCLDIDSFPISYYRHQYGHEEWHGRNINFALRQEGGQHFADIGNLIVLEHRDGQAGGVELAFGISTLNARKFSLKHPIEASLISTAIPFDLLRTCKLADAMAVALHLTRERLRPTASNTRGRILRTYIRGIDYLSRQARLNPSQVQQCIQLYELEEYGAVSDASELIHNYLIKGV